jgi:cytochrome P450 family 3 subfamily A
MHATENDFALLIVKSSHDGCIVVLFSLSGLTHEEVLAQSILFILAGYETSRTALSFLGYLLAVNPDYQDKVVAEINDVLEGRVS